MHEVALTCSFRMHARLVCVGAGLALCLRLGGGIRPLCVSSLTDVSWNKSLVSRKCAEDSEVVLGNNDLAQDIVGLSGRAD